MTTTAQWKRECNYSPPHQTPRRPLRDVSEATACAQLSFKYKLFFINKSLTSYSSFCISTRTWSPNLSPSFQLGKNKHKIKWLKIVRSGRQTGCHFVCFFLFASNNNLSFWKPKHVTQKQVRRSNKTVKWKVSFSFRRRGMFYNFLNNSYFWVSPGLDNNLKSYTVLIKIWFI